MHVRSGAGERERWLRGVATRDEFVGSFPLRRGGFSAHIRLAGFYTASDSECKMLGMYPMHLIKKNLIITLKK